VQPAENITPVVSRDAVARFGTCLLTVLDAASARLTTDSLRDLDAQVELAGHEPRLVAGDWLRAHGLRPEAGVVR
jgi:osmoprotectant transport system substrate-binding protein